MISKAFFHYKEKGTPHPIFRYLPFSKEKILFLWLLLTLSPVPYKSELIPKTEKSLCDQCYPFSCLHFLNCQVTLSPVSFTDFFFLTIIHLVLFEVDKGRLGNLILRFSLYLNCVRLDCMQRNLHDILGFIFVIL